MSQGKRVVVLVSADPSDIYFANHVAKWAGAVGIVVEHQSVDRGSLSRLWKYLSLGLRPVQFKKALARRMMEKKMQGRADAVTAEEFGPLAFELRPPVDCRVVHVAGTSAINSPEAITSLRDLRPDLVVVCGTSIIKDELLSIPPCGVLNLHGGLSQHYRGVWTTHWAVFNNEPEYIGATVHYVSPGIDDGDIVLQSRPQIEVTDNPESLYVKVVKLGIEMMVSAIEDIRNDRCQRYPLQAKGKLYLNRMMTPEVLQQAWANVDQGLLKDYL